MARRAFAASVVLYGAVVAVSAAVLPDRVPVHFGLELQADRYSSRAELLIVERLSPWSIVLLVAYLGFVAGWCVWLTRRRFRLPAAA